MQNSGAMVEAESVYFSSSKDENLILSSKAFYGFIDGDLGDLLCYYEVLLFNVIYNF